MILSGPWPMPVYLFFVQVGGFNLHLALGRGVGAQTLMDPGEKPFRHAIILT